MAPMWHPMANWTKDDESLLVDIQGQVTVEANVFNILPMRVGVHHENALKNFEFSGDENNFNINTGLLPLTLTLPGATLVQATTR